MVQYFSEIFPSQLSWAKFEQLASFTQMCETDKYLIGSFKIFCPWTDGQRVFTWIGF